MAEGGIIWVIKIGMEYKARGSGVLAKVVCESCNTSFLYEAAKNMELCPVCGKPLWDDGNSEHREELSFGESVKNPDLYFYDIDEKEEYDNDDLRDVWCQCTSCRKVNTIPYHTVDLILSPKNGLD